MAVVVAALEWLEAGDQIPAVAAGDIRWNLALAHRGGLALEDAPKSSNHEPYLRSLKKAQLVELLLELSALNPKVEADIEHRRTLASGDLPAVVKRLKAEIATATAREAGSNHWSDEDSLPDYSHIENDLKFLLAAEQPDALLELGQELLKAGQEQLERSNDECMTGMAISDCMAVVYRAVLISSLSDPEKIMYAVDLALADDYGLVDNIDCIVEGTWSKRTWSAVAKTLASRLDLSRPSGEPHSSSQYQRDNLSHWLAFSLDSAGREAEATRVFESEAPLTGSYYRLVLRLIEMEQLDEACNWALRGHAAALESGRGVPDRFREILHDIAHTRQQWPLVAACEAELFFKRPDVSGLGKLCSAAKRAGCEDEVREAALDFLETGVQPDFHSSWPLPPVQLPRETSQASEPKKHWDVLRDLAIHAGRPEDALLWHDRLRAGISSRRYGPDNSNLSVARAVSSTHPKRAIAMYLSAAEALINRTKPDAYVDAGSHLLVVKELLAVSNRLHEWPVIIAEIRTNHRPKRRLMEVLDGLEGRPIVRSQ